MSWSDEYVNLNGSEGVVEIHVCREKDAAGRKWFIRQYGRQYVGDRIAGPLEMEVFDESTLEGKWALDRILEGKIDMVACSIFNGNMGDDVKLFHWLWLKGYIPVPYIGGVWVFNYYDNGKLTHIDGVNHDYFKRRDTLELLENVNGRSSKQFSLFVNQVVALIAPATSVSGWTDGSLAYLTTPYGSFSHLTIHHKLFLSQEVGVAILKTPMVGFVKYIERFDSDIVGPVEHHITGRSDVRQRYIDCGWPFKKEEAGESR